VNWRYLGAALWLCVAAPACRYRVGGFLPDHIRSVSIPSVTLEELEVPASLDLETALTDAIRDRFVRDNSLTVLPGRSGDSLLDISVLRFGIVESAQELEMRLGLSFEFRDMLRDVELASSSDLEQGVVLPEGEDDEAALEAALATCADEIAGEIVALTLRGW